MFKTEKGLLLAELLPMPLLFLAIQLPSVIEELFAGDFEQMGKALIPVVIITVLVIYIRLMIALFSRLIKPPVS